ncbi:YlzJ-like family protein [Paenibacillus sp. DMB20]|uniref:YlzJ-like family protein n=1 Tax=Paenibacillus sp. DMB20 TaxID=1642570 RepID=UPI0006277EE9|nr:YlzJ-like family protein [Paenibacillus sp. DMB20]KKO53311.1 hypothetical protein XI25_13340 [Paenibacillus sp. DMB20]
MTFYTVMPLELVWPDANGSLPLQSKEIRIGRVLMEIEPVSENEARIVRLLDCELADYLNPDYTPGNTVEYIPAIRQNKP